MSGLCLCRLREGRGKAKRLHEVKGTNTKTTGVSYDSLAWWFGPFINTTVGATALANAAFTLRTESQVSAILLSVETRHRLSVHSALWDRGKRTPVTQVENSPTLHKCAVAEMRDNRDLLLETEAESVYYQRWMNFKRNWRKLITCFLIIY